MKGCLAAALVAPVALQFLWPTLARAQDVTIKVGEAVVVSDAPGVFPPLSIDVVEDVAREWNRAAAVAVDAGLARDRLVFDPGLGFTKNTAQSLELCARSAVERLAASGQPWPWMAEAVVR